MKQRKFFSFIMLAVMLIAAVSCGDDNGINYKLLQANRWHAVINWADGNKSDCYYGFSNENDGSWYAFITIGNKAIDNSDPVRIQLEESQNRVTFSRGSEWAAKYRIVDVTARSMTWECLEVNENALDEMNQSYYRSLTHFDAVVE